jgi:hypothetical protein
VEEKEQPHKIKSICKKLMLNISQGDVGPNTNNPLIWGTLMSMDTGEGKNNSRSLLVLGTVSNSESLEMPTIDSGSW